MSDSNDRASVNGGPPLPLFDKVVSILEQARSNVVRSVNTNMVVAYWLIGREIVEEIQGGEDRAEYGKQILDDLSDRLNRKYGGGFSVTSLKNMRQFFTVFRDRPGDPFANASASAKTGPAVNGQKDGGQSPSRLPLDSSIPENDSENEITENQKMNQIRYPTGSEFTSPSDYNINRPYFPRKNEEKNFHQILNQIRYPAGSEFPLGFYPQLSWSHYRALMRVKKESARHFYEWEAAECGWTKAQLERQIRSSWYDRIIAARGETGPDDPNRERLPGDPLAPVHMLKSPVVLEFLDLPDAPSLHESTLESAIIANLQSFLLELGKGFSFVARQRHIKFDDDDFYVDLVFYNFVLKFFLLVDLKIGKLSHRDVGQMDGYVRLFEDRFKVEGDNPTVGLILCSDKSEAVARYSVLNENRHIFASKYLPFLPSEQELAQEIEKERKLIEFAWQEKEDRRL